ncbi:MAG TPA: ABC transporter ATP-binding protein [Methylomirabilota bacterium]|nr:ABC transporter ATP-binding protein [Methylomirabilota bacterium]
MLLGVDGLSKSFGALAALSEVSFAIAPGELVALIGPNGAGKSTLFNLISGILAPDTGAITFAGERISSLPPHRIAHRGIGLAFQITNVFARLTVLENIQVALFSARGRSGSLLSFGPRTLRGEALEILDAIGLADAAPVTAGELAQADKKRLEVGIALAVRPRLLLLDEPTSGQSMEETALTTELIRTINEKQALTVLFIEHKMDVVFGIARRVLVLHNGRLIADGDPLAVRSDEQVQKAYLGATA